MTETDTILWLIAAFFAYVGAAASNLYVFVSSVAVAYFIPGKAAYLLAVVVAVIAFLASRSALFLTPGLLTPLAQLSWVVAVALAATIIVFFARMILRRFKVGAWA